MEISDEKYMFLGRLELMIEQDLPFLQQLWRPRSILLSPSSRWEMDVVGGPSVHAPFVMQYQSHDSQLESQR